MVFASPLFLFLFLPIVLLAHFAAPQAWRNLFLLIASLIFYAWGELLFVWVMLFSIGANWLWGLAIERSRRRRHWVLTLAVAFNLGLLGIFKYLDFLTENLNLLLDALGVAPLPLPGLRLPLGISFFTFHALSYLIDVHRGVNVAQRSLPQFALYISFFPQLIAGPIIRYHDVADQLARRTVESTLFASGLERFIAGLAKKVLLANPLGEVADTTFAMPTEGLGALPAWLGLICYAGQIYFDFSGYSDMAIGLARMFGFRFLENFNYPYTARSIQDFWRRWHISLSNWFRDYLYIPLGGNRTSARRVYFNLVLVFLLCGLWHGASWNFVVWGLLHGFFMLIERAGWGAYLARLPRLLQHLYTLGVVLIAWVFFRAVDFSSALDFLAALFGRNGAQPSVFVALFNPQIGMTMFVALLASTPIFARLTGDWRERLAGRLGTATVIAQSLSPSAAMLRGLAHTLLLLLSIAFLAANTYNPFIYFRF